MILKNGSVLQGKISERSEGGLLHLELPDGRIALPWSEVDRVIVGPEGNWIDPPPPAIRASSALLLEEGSGRIMLEKNPKERRQIASLTKLMTAVMAQERGCLRDMVRVSRRAALTSGASLRLKAGQRVRMRDLLLGMLMRSANDASVAVAEHIGGSEEEFVRLMNKKARSLGLFDTHFRNCHGLDEPGHYSSAYDMAKLSRYAISFPFLADCVRKREIVVSLGGNRRPKIWRNSNKLLRIYLGADGIKTGYTEEAGKCLVASAQRGGLRLIAVLLNDEERWNDACELLEYGFSVLGREKAQALISPERLKADEEEFSGSNTALEGLLSATGTPDVIPLSGNREDINS